jgi:hypothetical protein
LADYLLDPSDVILNFPCHVLILTFGLQIRILVALPTFSLTAPFKNLNCLPLIPIRVRWFLLLFPDRTRLTLARMQRHKSTRELSNID